MDLITTFNAIERACTLNGCTALHTMVSENELVIRYRKGEQEDNMQFLFWQNFRTREQLETVIGMVINNKS